MAVFRCKMCGGTLEVVPGASVIECEYCGTRQTLPRLDDDKKANLYDRANHFRRNNEFDKAMGIYEQILNEDGSDAEAYWSIVLCRYGIEYVEDPASHRRIPTVNRAQFTSIFDDDNYKSALQYADGYQRHLYEEEAKAINEIQKGILAISRKEEPFDVFICYKETDHNGRRTPDSVLAQELYYELTREGFKVFFSRITLEDKLGSAYEPYIFAALNSAKVMVVLGTKAEHFNAVWVKNEWSRYLALIKQGQKKMLIPAYRDMDPYDLPEEFSHLQGQDMSKLGFMQDLVRGIKKIIQVEDPKPTVVQETVVVSGGSPANIEPLLRRAYLFLEDGAWDSANEYCEKVLDMDPENAQAYLGKLMASLRVRRKEALADCSRPFDLNDNYRKIVRFADPALRSELAGYVEHIKERNEKARLESEYSDIVHDMNRAGSEGQFKAVAARFDAMGDYKDARALSRKCLDKAEEARLAALERAETAHKKELYSAAMNLKKRDTVADLEQAIQLLRDIPGWEDGEDQIYACEKRIFELRAEEERLRLEGERQAELARMAAEEKRRKTKRTLKIAIPSAAVAAVAALLLVFLVIPTQKLNNAISLMESGSYDRAREILVSLNGFRSCGGKVILIDAMEEVEKGQLDTAIKRALSARQGVNVEYDVTGNPADRKTVTLAAASDYTGLLLPQREGYRFVEWVLEDYGYSEETSLTVALRAVWADGYTISYDLDGGAAENPVEYHKDDAESITLTAPTKKGCTFLGWTGTDLSEPTLSVTIPAGSHGDRAYTAHWEPTQYTLTLDPDGGAVSAPSVTAGYGTAYTLPRPEKEYYIFKGWYDGSALYTDGTWRDTGDVTLTAKWEPVVYRITYSTAGGTNSSDNPTQFTVESSALYLAPATRTGYKFAGWYSDSGYKTKVTEIPAASHGDISLYAKWEIITYTVSYQLNGGYLSGTKVTQFTVEDLPVALPSANKSGLVFLNWSVGAYDGAAISEITEVGDLTLVASYMDPNLKLTKKGDGYAVSDYGGTASHLDIPAYYNGLPVTEIANSAFYVGWSGTSTLVSISLPSTITRIGDSAFEYCETLKSIVIPDSVVEIGEDAFYRCESLTSIDLPDSLKVIGGCAFGHCESLQSIRLPDSLLTLGGQAFTGCISLRSITIPAGVRGLEHNTFSDCRSLSSVQLQEGLTSIGWQAFEACRSLTSLVIPASVKTIEAGAFTGCSNITLYCRAKMLPDGWDSGWNSSRPVVWGYGG